MKKCIHSIFILLVMSLLVSCESSEEKKRKMEVQLMSTQTLGLAYLEEMKLEEAEAEFKKFIELAPDEKLGYANLGLVYLRMGQYEEAEARLSEAKSLDESDPDVNLLLATTYRLQGKNKEAIEVLEETLETNPEHPKVLFELCELYGVEQDGEAEMKRQGYLERLTAKTPGNLVPMIFLVESYIKQGNADSALAEFEKLPAQFPDFPAESMPYYDQVVESLQAGNTGDALIPFTVFHNYQKVTYPYQAGMTDLKGPGESALGIPLINYSETAAMSGEMAGEIVETRRVYARTVAQVEARWIEEAAGHLLKRRHADPHWSLNRGEAQALERDLGAQQGGDDALALAAAQCFQGLLGRQFRRPASGPGDRPPGLS